MNLYHLRSQVESPRAQLPAVTSNEGAAGRNAGRLARISAEPEGMRHNLVIDLAVASGRSEEPLDFSALLGGLHRAALYYGMERWRYQARCLACVAVMFHCHQRPDEEDERGPECFHLWQKWETPLLSLDAALEATCFEHNFDVADVRHLVEADGPYQVQGLGKLDPQLVAEMTLAFDGVFESDR